MNKARKGANFERELMKLALQKGATLVIRGAGSKSKSIFPNLKIDLVIVKDGKIYFIQAKHHKQKATQKEKDAFYNAAFNAHLQQGIFVSDAEFIENKEQLDIMLGLPKKNKI